MSGKKEYLQRIMVELQVKNKTEMLVAGVARGRRKERTRCGKPETDAYWMAIALEEAKQAQASGEVPVGAVLVRNGALLARARNQPLSRCDPTAHAEVLALRAAAASLGNYRLTGTTLYVTVEPCPMCSGALLQARVTRVVFGASDPKAGAVVSLFQLFDDPRLNHRIQWTEGVLREACAEIMSGFFRVKRLSLSP